MVIGNITPPRKRADFRRVFRHEIVVDRAETGVR